MKSKYHVEDAEHMNEHMHTQHPQLSRRLSVDTEWQAEYWHWRDSDMPISSRLPDTSSISCKISALELFYVQWHISLNYSRLDYSVLHEIQR